MTRCLQPIGSGQVGSLYICLINTQLLLHLVQVGHNLLYKQLTAAHWLWAGSVRYVGLTGNKQGGHVTRRGGASRPRKKHSLCTHLTTLHTTLHGVRCTQKPDSMAFSSLKPSLPLNPEDNLSVNLKTWKHTDEIYAVAAGVMSKAEKVQCCIFLHVAGLEAQTVHRTIQTDSLPTEKKLPPS